MTVRALFIYLIPLINSYFHNNESQRQKKRSRHNNVMVQCPKGQTTSDNPMPILLAPIYEKNRSPIIINKRYFKLFSKHFRFFKNSTSIFKNIYILETFPRRADVRQAVARKNLRKNANIV